MPAITRRKMSRFNHGLMLLACCCAAEPLAAEPRLAALPETLTGSWQISADLPDLMQYDVRTSLQFREHRAGRFDADSRSGAVRKAYGFWRSLVMRSLSGGKLRRGAWLHIEGGQRHADGRLTGTLTSVFTPDLALDCHAVNEGYDCLLQSPQRRPGKLRMRRGNEVGMPLRDYAGLPSKIEGALQQHVFQPTLLRSPQWRPFLDRLGAAVGSARDDLDALAAWYRVAGAAPVSHLALLRGSPAQLRSQDGKDDPDAATAAAIVLTWHDDVATLRISTFGLDVDAMHGRLKQVFTTIAERPARALIVDVRGNPGGNFSSMLVAGHLSAVSTPAGYFLGNVWWRDHQNAPSHETAAQRLPRFDQPSMSLFVQTMREQGGLYGVVEPLAPRFDGPVYVLSDQRSASATEPLVYHLQRTGRATVVGEATAGAMLSSDLIDLGDGWSLLLPVADYYAADGTRLEGRGVIPDVPVAAAQAWQRALELAASPTRRE